MAAHAGIYGVGLLGTHRDAPATLWGRSGYASGTLRDAPGTLWGAPGALGTLWGRSGPLHSTKLEIRIRSSSFELEVRTSYLIQQPIAGIATKLRGVFPPGYLSLAVPY